MNIHDLREAQAKYESQIDETLKSRSKLYRLRNAFARHYSAKRIEKMPIDHFAIGNYPPENGYNFCYTLERELDGLGRIIGATSFKFGVYFGKTRSDPKNIYRFTKKFGNNVEEAFHNVKQELIDLLVAGKNQDIITIIKNKTSPMFKGKILSTYYPDRYLNVFSDKHLEYFLIQLNLDNDYLISSDPVIKREALLNFKNSDSVMKHWSTDLFSNFLYQEYPGRPPGEDRRISKKLNEYGMPQFPANPKPIWIDMNIGLAKVSVEESKKRKGKKNPDYEKKARRNKKLGDRGEKIVLDMEKNRLLEAGHPKLSRKVKKAKFDYQGFDIRSFDETGEIRYIEVKSTQSKVGFTNFFLSTNELKEAKKLKNYYVYIVFDILSNQPKIWRLKNPFNPENKNIKMIPISYRIEINSLRN